MVTVPFPPFEPDKSRFNGGAMPEMVNVRPVADGWSPIPGLTPNIPAFVILVSEDDGSILTGDGDVILIAGPGGASLGGPISLPSQCLGSIFVRTANNVSRAFFGTSDTLYEYDFTAYVFKVVGSGYNVPVNGRWSFAQFGTDVYAQNGQDPEQVIDLIAGTVFTVNATAPVATYLASVGDFLVRARLASDPSTLQWSALNDPTSNDAGDKGSDIQFIPDGNGITGIVPMSFGAVVFCRDSIHQMNFALTTDFIFTFNPITKYRGAIAPYSICAIGQDDFVFYSADGFFRGAAMSPIGSERVDRWFISQTEEPARLSMTSAPDYRRKIVWFRYQNTAGEYHLLGYQWQLDKWCQCDADLVDMLKAETPGVTIDGLDNLYASIDDIDVQFDSSSFDGGSAEFAGITQDGYFAFMNGQSRQATISTNEIAFNGTNRTMANGGRLLSDAMNYTVAVSTTNYDGGDFTDRNPSSPTTRTKQLAFRANGRTHKFKLIIPESEPWTIVNSLDVDVSQSGKA